jgi:hypothetical protein
VKRAARFVAVIVALLVITPVLPAQAAPYCGIRWGSLPKGSAADSSGQVVDVRAGRHACFDRLVLDVDGDIRGYSVRYVSGVVDSDADTVVPLRGGADLAVTANVPALATDAFFIGRGRDVIDTAGYRTFRQVRWAGSENDATTVGLGVRARLPFRVFVLDGPGDRSRLVVDVAHRW